MLVSQQDSLGGYGKPVLAFNITAVPITKSGMRESDGLGTPGVSLRVSERINPDRLISDCPLLHLL